MAFSTDRDKLFWWILIAPPSTATALLLIRGVVSSGREWMAVGWVVTSMSAFWALNRILHGVRGTPGETERDGVIWLVPLAAGLLPSLALTWFQSPFAQAISLLLGSLLATGLIMFLRPEIDHEVFEPKYLERVGVLSSIGSLFKYRLNVAVRKFDVVDGLRSASQPKSRFSTSCLVYYTGFALTGSVLIAVTPILDRMTPEQVQKISPGWITVVGAGIFALFAAFVAGLSLTYKEDRIGWRIYEGERQILAILYFVSTCNVVLALLFAIALPLLRRTLMVE